MLQKLNLGTSPNDKTGTKARTGGQIINDNFTYLESKIDNENVVLVEAGYTLVGNVLTMNAGWQWMINGVTYTNPASVPFTIPYAVAGKKRLDVIVMNTSNSFIRISGAETTGNPITPIAIAQTIKLHIFNVSENAIFNIASAAPFLGTIKPTSTPTGSGPAFWRATEAGVYTNFGGFTVAANSIAEFGRDAAGTFSISQTALVLTDYAKVVDLANKADLVVGKNKFNYLDADVKRGFYLGANGAPTPFTPGYDLFSISGFIPATVGQILTVNQAKHYNVYNCFYDSNKVFITGSNSIESTVTAPTNAAYVRYTLSISSTANIATANFQIELGSVATTYTAYAMVVNPNQVQLTDYTKTVDLYTSLPLKADLVASKNLFNKATTTDGFYLSNFNSIVALAGFCYSDYIAVIPNQTYRTTTKLRFTTYYNASKGYISGGSGTEIQTATSIVMPANVYFIRFTLEGLALKDTCQFELGAVSTDYTSFGFKVIESQLPTYKVSNYNNKIANPLKQHFLTTIENNIYLAEFQKRVLPNFILDTTPNVGSRKNDIIRALNPTAGSYSITNALVDLDYADVMRKNYTAVVTNLSKTTAINVLSVGDSYTDIGSYVKKMGETIPNITHVGMCKTLAGTDVKREGRSGWTLAKYMTETGSTSGTSFFSPFLHPVEPYKYYGNTDFWKKVFIGTAPAYEIDTFKPLLTTLNINSLGVKSTPTVNDVMYFTIDSAYKYWNGSAWTVISSDSLGFTFNFAKYLTTWAIPTPDVVTVLLGMNDFRSVTPTAFDAFFIGWKANLDTFIASAKVANANIKIVIATCNSTEYNDLSGKVNAALWEGYNAVINAYDNREGEKIYISDTKVSVDRVLGFSGTRAIPFSNYTGSETIWITQGDVHLNTGGMNQIGEKLAATIQYAR